MVQWARVVGPHAAKVIEKIPQSGFHSQLLQRHVLVMSQHVVDRAESGRGSGPSWEHAASQRRLTVPTSSVSETGTLRDARGICSQCFTTRYQL
jgi:hypothetical protein